MEQPNTDVEQHTADEQLEGARVWQIFDPQVIIADQQARRVPTSTTQVSGQARPPSLKYR